MITSADFYHVMTAVVPLYVAMILAYAAVKWWKIFTPDQCAGINRFVALFAVPLLSFHVIATNDPYAMNLRFIAADVVQKLLVLSAVVVWNNLIPRNRLPADWTITLFSLSTLPNSLVMGIPLLKGMYGENSGALMVQIVVLQCVIWYTLMLFMFEYRAAKTLISDQFPATAASIASIRVDPDVVSFGGGKDQLETEAKVEENGRIHVSVRRSNASASDTCSKRSNLRLSNLTNVEIYSLQSSRMSTPRGSSFDNSDFYYMMGSFRDSNFGSSGVLGLSASRGPTPRQSSFEEEAGNGVDKSRHYSTASNPGVFASSASAGNKQEVFSCSSVASPSSDLFSRCDYGTTDRRNSDVKEMGGVTSFKQGENGSTQEDCIEREGRGNGENERERASGSKGEAMPPTTVMTRLILIMVWRKLIRNPNTYSSLVGLTWSMISFRWRIKIPAIISKSISVLSDAGLGMAMFSLGLFMALQPRIIACGNSVAVFAMAVRFLAGPAVMAAASFMVRLRGALLRIAIVQAALPQGIVPFVFAKEYDLHPDILSTAVIFGMLIALPITLVYYILLGL